MKNKLYATVFLLLFLIMNVSSQTASWTIYDSVTTVAPLNFTNAVAIDKTSNKWVGTTNAGIIKYEGTGWTVFNTSNSDLPHDCIYDIEVDAQNNLWIGTAGGLAYFDGVNWTVYDASSTPFSFGSVVAITIDYAGNVWVYSMFCGAYALVRIQGIIITSFTPANSGIPDAWVRDIKVDENDNVWLAAYDKGLIKYDGTNWTVFNPANSGLPDSLASALAIGKDGDIWVGMYRGLARFDGSTWTVYNPYEVNVLTVADNGDVWVGYDGYGVEKFDGTNWTHYTAGSSDLPENFITDIEIDDSHSVWIGTTSKGVAVLNETISGINDAKASLTGAVFPNPFSNQLLVQLSNTDETTVTIYDGLSRQVLQQHFTTSTTISTEQMPNGIYYYELRNSEGAISSGKIIKH
jgi:ligand-binding sensor domain-containing protein